MKFPRPRILIPILLTAALLAFAFSITDLPKVMGNIRSIPVYTWLMALGFAALYLLLKGMEFSLFLRALGLSIPWRQLIVAYAVGELCVTIPSGIYVQNYVLNKMDAASFARSAAATTAMLVIEGTFVLVSLLVLSIPGWGWLRPVILAVFAVAAVLAITLRRFDWIKVLRVPLRPRHWVHVLALGFLKMLGELRYLRPVRVTGPGVVLTCGYLFALVGAFLAVGHGIGAARLTFLQAVTIYFFSLSVMLTVGSVLTQVGVIEVAGLGAAQAWGYSLNEGLAMLLGFRILWTAAIWLLNGALLVLLHSEFTRSPGHHVDKSTH